MGRKITMNGHIGQSVAEVYQGFILAKTAEGVSDITIRNYHQHLHNISKYLDIEQEALNVSKEEKAKWADIRDNMYFGEDKDLGIFVQNDCFLDKDLRTVDTLHSEDRPLNQNFN